MVTFHSYVSHSLPEASLNSKRINGIFPVSRRKSWTEQLLWTQPSNSTKTYQYTVSTWMISEQLPTTTQNIPRHRRLGRSSHGRKRFITTEFGSWMNGFELGITGMTYNRPDRNHWIWINVVMFRALVVLGFECPSASRHSQGTGFISVSSWLFQPSHWLNYPNFHGH